MTPLRERVSLLGRGATFRERNLGTHSYGREIKLRMHFYKYRVISSDNYQVESKFDWNAFGCDSIEFKLIRISC